MLFLVSSAINSCPNLGSDHFLIFFEWKYWLLNLNLVSLRDGGKKKLHTPFPTLGQITMYKFLQKVAIDPPGLVILGLCQVSFPFKE